MFRYRTGPYFFSGARIILGISAGLSFFALVAGSIGALIPILIAAPFVFADKMTEINFTTGMFRICFSLFGMTSGNWESTQHISYISVFRAKLVSRYSSRGTSTEQHSEKFQVNLITDNKERITVASTESEERALSVAKEIAAGLKLRLYYSVGHDRRWLD